MRHFVAFDVFLESPVTDNFRYISFTQSLTDLGADFNTEVEWSTLIGRDTGLLLVEPYYAGAKVYAITTHLKASKKTRHLVPFSVLLWHGKWLPCTGLVQTFGEEN